MNKDLRTAAKETSVSVQSWLLGSLLALLLSWSGSLLAQRTVTLVSDPWPPYVYGELGGTATSGIAVELLAEIFRRMDNIDMRMHIIPWKRALLEVEKGYYDGIPMLLKTSERKKYLVYSIPVLVGENLVWSVEKTSGEYFEWQNLDDFAGKRIGIIQDYSYGQSIDKEIAEGALRVVTVPSVRHLFEMLVNGRVDVALANDAVGISMLKQFPGIKIKSSKKPTDTDTYYFALSKKSKFADLMPEINKIIRELQREGVIERLVQTH